MTLRSPDGRGASVAGSVSSLPPVFLSVRWVTDGNEGPFGPWGRGNLLGSIRLLGVGRGTRTPSWEKSNQDPEFVEGEGLPRVLMEGSSALGGRDLRRV